MIILTGRPERRDRNRPGHVHGGRLAAEVAADATGVDDDLVFREPQRVGELLSQRVRHFVVGPHLYAPGGVDSHHAGIGLHVALVHPGGGKGMLENQVRFSEALRQVSGRPGGVVQDIPVRLNGA